MNTFVQLFKSFWYYSHPLMVSGRQECPFYVLDFSLQIQHWQWLLRAGGNFSQGIFNWFPSNTIQNFLKTCSSENCLCCVVVHQKTYYIGYNFYIWASAETTDLWVMKLRIFRLFPIGLAFLGRGLLRYSSTFVTKFCWLRQQRADVLGRIFCAMLLGVSYFCQTLSGTLFRLKTCRIFRNGGRTFCWMMILPESI